MIYIEDSDGSSTVFKVERIGGHYYGWNDLDEWSGDGFTLFPDSVGFMQRLLAPSILDRW
jgi:hypothetical protein